MTSKPETISGVLLGITIVVITFKLYVPTEGSFPVQVKYFDVVRRTSTTLDVLLESRIDDYWHLDGGRGTVGAVDRFHSVHSIERKASGMVTRGPERGLTKDQAISGPVSVWPKVWSSVSKSSQNKEKLHWAIEKMKLDSARKSRGVYDIDPDDMEFKDTMKNA